MLISQPGCPCPGDHSSLTCSKRTPGSLPPPIPGWLLSLPEAKKHPKPTLLPRPYSHKLKSKFPWALSSSQTRLPCVFSSRTPQITCCPKCPPSSDPHLGPWQTHGSSPAPAWPYRSASAARRGWAQAAGRRTPGAVPWVAAAPRPRRPPLAL
jgi:hypothetical protein